MSPTKKKKVIEDPMVRPELTQVEAMDVAVMLAGYKNVLQSIGDIDRAAYCDELRQKVVEASGRAPMPE